VQHQQARAAALQIALTLKSFREGHDFCWIIHAANVSFRNFLNPVILKAFFWPKDLPRYDRLKRTREAFRPMPRGFLVKKPRRRQIKSAPSREILRATEALQDDKFYTVSNFSVTRVVDKPA